MPDLSLDFPVLLGPVRVETRYTQDRLLIRVFPDEWSIDKFEPRPTQAELAALDAYWTAYWASAGSPVGEQTAWHELVARVPAGRAGWLLQSHKPANPADRPSGVAAGTTVLVIVSATSPAANDRQPSITYWTSVWRAHGDGAKLRDADIAMMAAVGATRANTIRARRPQGIDAAPVSSGDAVVSFLVLPPPPVEQIAPKSWTVAAKATLLPDKFVAFGYVNGVQVFAEPGGPVRPELAVSPDPGETKENQLRIDETTGALKVPPALRWLTEFQAAFDAGMGIRIELKDEFRHGLDRLVVLGLRQQATPEQSATALGGLLTRQLRSPAGFSLLPQGTPTNNTEQAPAGQDPKAEAEAGLATIAGFAAAASDWTTKTDGEWLADLLGLDPAVLAGVPNAEGTDRRDARAAHTALWPATWGYYLQALLNGVLDDDQIAQTRRFFLEHVSGRGPLPAVKIGRQPYGILPTTVFSRLDWPDTAKHRKALNKVLKEVAKDWHTALDHVTHLDGPGDDPHQRLLDILALHPTSAEYHQRYAQSVEDLFNRENLRALGPKVPDALEGPLNMPQPILALLARFGHPIGVPAAEPDLLRRLFTDVHHPLLAPLVDDRPLSETDLIRAYTADGRNYLRWLADYARTDLDTVRKEEGFLDDRPPAALLYLLARHAVLLGWAEAARRLALATPGDEAPSSRDAPFVHVKIPKPGETILSESRYRKLYSTDPLMTGGQTALVHEYLRTVLGADPATTDLDEQIKALDVLATLPTARLERVLAEHIDCATYRLDAWRLGLANERLAELRYGPGGAAPPKRGVHLGAYGWLENIPRNETDELDHIPPPADLTTVFGTDEIPHDPHNGGYVHAPSPAQARTAAVLRAGHLANRKPDNANAFAVNLSSERVRLALTILDGMRQGQSLGALLGYRFERGLHDRRAGLDRYIAGLRLKFPLRANKIEETVPTTDDPRPKRIEEIEARNVIHGLELLRHVNSLPETEQYYPFGFTDLKPAEDPGVVAAIGKEIDALRNVQDALADLAVAEGTHQALQGHPERASATLDAYAKEGVPPEPTVVETPRSGITLTHRLGLQLASIQGAPLGQNNPRATAEPAVNVWLSAVLPKPSDVGALVTWLDPGDGRERHRFVTQDEAGLQPIDLLWALRPADEAAMTDLDDRILGVVIEKSKPRPDVELTIKYTTRVSDEGEAALSRKIGFFELSPLVSTLRALLTTARPLRPSDLIPAAGSALVNRAADDAVALPRERPAKVLEALTGLGAEVEDFIADLGTLYPANGDPVRAELVKGIDTFLSRYAKLTVAAGGFGLARSSWGELALWRHGVFAAILAAVAEVAGRMSRALADADALIGQYDHLPSATPIEERFRILQQAERLLTTKPGPRPSTPAQLRTRVGNLRQDFNTRVGKLKQEAKTTKTTLSALLAEVAAQLPLTDYDPAGLDLAPHENQVVAYGRELLTRAGKLKDELKARGKAAAAALVIYDKAIPGPDKVRAGTDALKALLGEDVLAVPQFTPANVDEWRKARNDSDKLVARLMPARDFPVDDWLHGMARVREKPRLWEKVVLLASALLGPGGLLGTGLLGWKEPALTPVQLPYVAGDHWLAMEFVEDPKPLDQLDQDRLLFTAHYAAPSTGNLQCGLVFDEWTEVIPAERETTGIALHYDGPDAEPPQAMLLVVPPVRDPGGHWTPADLVEAITETFEMAKARAVEPEHLDGTAYAHMLPATVISATRRHITVSTDLAIANLRWKAAHE
jgi:hypothetical protein